MMQCRSEVYFLGIAMGQKKNRKNMDWNYIRESYSKSISDYKKQSEHLYALIQLYNWLIKLMEGLSVLIS